MASISPMKETKDGKRYFEIRVRMGREGQTLSSRWYVPEGKAWSEGTINKKVDAAAKEFERQCKAGEVKTKKQLREEQERQAQEEAKVETLRSFVEKIFMPELTVGCSEHTRSSYQGNFIKHIFPALGSFKMTEITSSQIEALLLEKQREGYKVATCIKIYGILFSVFRKAHKKKVIDRNPMDEVDKPKPTKAEGKDTKEKAFSDEETAYLLECADELPLKWKAMIYIGLYTGCRKGEIAALKWDRIDFNTGEVIIDQNLCYTPQKGVYVDTPKNGKSRQSFFVPEVMEILRELKASQNVIPMAKGSGYIFTQEDLVTPMHPDSPTWYFKRLGKRLGINDLHPHKLRHTCATMMDDDGESEGTIAEVLGQTSSKSVTERYIHRRKARIQRTLEAHADHIKAIREEYRQQQAINM